MKKLIGIPIFLVMLALTSCEDESGKGDNNTPGANEIFMRGSIFSPSTLTVSAGTIVKWTNNDNMPHTVTNPLGLFDSGTLNPGESYTFVFNIPDTYIFFCQLHANMNGTIVVN